MNGRGMVAASKRCEATRGMGTSVLAFSAACDANAMNSDKIRFLWLLDAKEEAGRGLRAPLSHYRCAEASKYGIQSGGKESDTTTVPRTDTEINRNLISVLR